MGRSFFKDNLASSVTKKKAPAGEGIETVAMKPQIKEDIFDDVSVCRMLHIHRRVLADARTQQTRGKDWDVVDLHAGMTKSWIMNYATKHGLVPDFTNGAFKKIMPGDNVVSVFLVGTHPNPFRCTVELVATGTREFCSVRNLYQYPIHLKEAFDAKRVETNLEWVAHLNDCRY